MARVRAISQWLRTSLTALLLVIPPATLLAPPANMPPTLTITGYGLGPYFVGPCAADATDPDGWVVRVEFFANGARIGESTEPPYCYWWSNMAVGTYVMTAVATDNKGATGASPPLTIEVRHPFGGHMLAPTNGQTFVLGEEVWMAAGLTNGEGSVTLRYTFDGYNGGFPELTNPPYKFVYTPYSLGKHHVSAVAVEEPANPNAYAIFGGVDIYVIPARGFPVITLQPTNQVVPPGTDVVLAVSAFAELPVSYQWRFNGVNLPNATNAALVLPAVSVEHAGAYSVLVTTAAGALPSEAAFVDISLRKPGTVLFANRYVSRGSVLVDAPLSLAEPNLEARLYAGPRPDAMTLIEPSIAVSGAYFNGGTREIPTVAPGATAYVRIVVHNLNRDPNDWRGGEVSNDLIIEPVDKGRAAPLTGLEFSEFPAVPPLEPEPEFLGWRNGLTMGTAGKEFTLGMTVLTSKPTLSYQWEKDGQDIPGAAGSCQHPGRPWRYGCDAAVVFPNLQTGDAASYRLRVFNGQRYAVSPPIFLGVIEAAP